MRNDPQFKDAAVADPDVPGVDAISGRVVTYPVTLRVRISRKDAVLRELRRRILQAFEQNAIPLGTDPANMLLMHHSDPTAPPAQQPLTGSSTKQNGRLISRRPLKIHSKRIPTNSAPPPSPRSSAVFTGGWQVCPLHTTAKLPCIFGSRGSVVSKTGGNRPASTRSSRTTLLFTA